MAVVLVVACVVATAVPALAQSGDNGLDATESAVVVSVQPDGSAVFTVRYTYDLTDDARAAAFTELRTNETAVTAFEERFQNRMGAVAAAAERNMSVEDVDLTLRSSNGTGVAALSVTWQNLARVDNEQLTITEPFASGFVTDRPLAVRAPDGYEIVRATPAPDARADGWVRWSGGRDLGGFEVVLEPSETPATESPDTANEGTNGASGPGFGILGVVVAAGLAMALVLRRR